jgi:hypothetical protein
VHHRANRLEGDVVAQMAPSDTDHCVYTESRIEHSRCGALDIRGGDKSAPLIPIRLVFRNKVDKHDKLALGFDALVLSQMLGCEIGTGKIIHGNNYTTLKVNTGALTARCGD